MAGSLGEALLLDPVLDPPDGASDELDGEDESVDAAVPEDEELSDAEELSDDDNEDRRLSVL